MNKFEDMKLFCHVAEKGSFAQAAQLLGVTPAIVGRRISALENALGFKLFNRTTRRMQITSAGQSYYDGSKRLLEDVQELEESIFSQNTHSPSGLIRISGPDSLGESLLLDAIQIFQGQYPDIRFDLQLDNHPIDLVKENIDLTFRMAFNLQDSSYVGIKLFDTTFGLYASADYLARKGTPKSLKDLDQHDCLNMNANRYGDCWNILKDGEVIRYRQPWKLMTSNNSTFMEAIKRGMGIGLIPDLFTSHKVKAGEITQIENIAQFPVVGLYAIYPSRKHVPHRLKLFLEFIKSHVTEHN